MDRYSDHHSKYSEHHIVSVSKNNFITNIFILLGVNPNGICKGYIASGGHHSTIACPLLNLCALQRNLNGVRLLLDRKANVNSRIKYYQMEHPGITKEQTPLHIACRLDRAFHLDDPDGVELVKLLLKNGADVNAKDENRSTPLDIANWKKNTNKADLIERRIAQQSTVASVPPLETLEVDNLLESSTHLPSLSLEEFAYLISYYEKT